MTPRRSEDAEAVLAMPVHNAGPHLTEALGSILGQEGRELALVALDDASSDGSLGVLQEWAREDPRIVVHASATRLGILRAWNRVLELALAHAPAARYVAWAGDHDRWAPTWLDTLSRALDEHPAAVLAVPLTRKVDADGTVVREDERRLDTRGIADPLGRVRATVRQMVAGNQIYGLFRREALERVLPVPNVLLFDRLVLAAAALDGPILQVDEHLWDRRTFRKPVATVLERERATFWPEGAPAWSRLPPVVQGGAVLAGRALSGRLAPGIPRTTALRASAAYVRETRRVEKEVAERRRRRAERAARKQGA